MKPGDLVRGGEKRIDAATVRLTPEGVIRLEGRILASEPADDFDECLRCFHETSVKEPGKRVVIDVARLEWISEGALRALVTWILGIDREPPSRRYRVAFRINTAVPWQHGTFRALLSVAPDVVDIE